MITPTEKTCIGAKWSSEIISIENGSLLLITGTQRGDGWTVACTFDEVLRKQPFKIIASLCTFKALIVKDSDGRYGIGTKDKRGEWSEVYWTQCADLQDAITAATGDKAHSKTV